MSKLITAKEAFALSNPETNIDKHIEHINQQIRYACQRQERRVACELWDCTDRTAVAISARLRAAGYYFSWTDLSHNRKWFTISWGGKLNGRARRHLYVLFPMVHLPFFS